MNDRRQIGEPIKHISRQRLCGIWAHNLYTVGCLHLIYSFNLNWDLVPSGGQLRRFVDQWSSPESGRAVEGFLLDERTAQVAQESYTG